MMCKDLGLYCYHMLYIIDILKRNTYEKALFKNLITFIINQMVQM